MGKYDAMKARVREGGGLAVATLGELREAIGLQRLGPYVLKDVSDTLKREGLDFFPRDTIENNPAPRQWEAVRIVEIDPNSPIYKAMKAIEVPAPDGDVFLISLATQSAAADAARLQSRVQRARGAIEDALAILNEPDDVEE